MTDLTNLDSFWDYNNPAETAEKFRDLLDNADEFQSGDRRWELLTQLARTHSLRREFEQAHAILNKVEAVPNTEEVSPLVRVRYLLERGRTYNSAGHVDTARPLFVKAWQLGKEEQLDTHAVDAAHMVAITWINDTEKALKWNQQAMEYAEASDDLSAKKWLGALYNNIGWTYHDAEDYEKALEIFKKALVWRETEGTPVPLRIAKWSVARTLRSLGKLDAALKIQEALLQEWDAAGEADGYVYEEFAECHHALGNTEQARPYFRLAHEEISKDGWMREHEKERLARLKSLGTDE